MRYTELAVSVAPAQAELAASILRELTGEAASIDQPFTQTDLESDAVPRVDSPAIVRVYVREGARNCEGDIRDSFADAEIEAALSSRTVAEEDWAEAWKQYFDVERYGARLVVVPSWRTYTADDDDVALTLDPGMAFGTGQHETTRMCLEAVERYVTPGARVLDVGCGSGILAIAAAKLGGREVLAVDIDSDCVRITRENAGANGADAIVDARAGSMGASWPFAVPAAGFDVVVANIIARVIVEIAEPLSAALAPSGRLIVSGVIGEREDEVRGALRAAGLRVDDLRAMADWRCIEAVRA